MIMNIIYAIYRMLYKEQFYASRRRSVRFSRGMFRMLGGRRQIGAPRGARAGEGGIYCDQRFLLTLSGRVHDNGQDSLEHEGQQEVGFFDRQVVGSTGTVVAQISLATGSAAVEFGALADYDASGLAFVRAVSLEGPHLLAGGRVRGAGGVGKSLHLQHTVSSLRFPNFIKCAVLPVLRALGRTLGV